MPLKYGFANPIKLLCLSKDNFHLDGRELRPGRFYDYRFELVDPVRMESVRLARVEQAEGRAEDNTQKRLTTKVRVAEALVKQQLKWRYENGG